MKRPIRIGNCSGVTGDGLDQMYIMATKGPIDAIFADYLAEMNIAWQALEIRDNPELGYDRSFLAHLNFKNTAQIIAEKGIKIVHNGGGLNPFGLYKATKELFASKGFPETHVAYLDGDNVTGLVQCNPGRFKHLDIAGSSVPLNRDIISASAYVGMRGIVDALGYGAQIVICGRVCDTSPVMGLSAWWHGWSNTDFSRLAGSLIAGHITECGAYATGGNFCDFTSISNMLDVGFPICEVADDGSCIITMHDACNGAVTVDTVKAQLVYEIQGPIYLNPDVQALLEDICIEDIGSNRVLVHGAHGLAPPPTTKLAVCMSGGYQAEWSVYATGLGIQQKYELLKKQVLNKIDPTKFHKLTIDMYGSSVPDPRSQTAATVQIRIFVIASDPEVINSMRAEMLTWLMSGFAGIYMNITTFYAALTPKLSISYFPALIPQDMVTVQVHLDDGTVLDIPPVVETLPFNGQRSYDPNTPVDMKSFGTTVRAPLGSIVLGRSGDKGGNSNVGLWVRTDCEWSWLQSFMTIERYIDLLGDDYKPEFRIERFEMPHLYAVHFVCYGILEEGTSSSSRIDSLGKAISEFIRARLVDVPAQFMSCKLPTL